MCLLAIGVEAHPDFPLIVAANRDEFHARETAPAKWWLDSPQILAGRDLEAGGTWLGVTTSGRFAAVTNFRDPSQQTAGARSRGELVHAFLAGATSAEEEAREVFAGGREFNGFNLVLGDTLGVWCVSNRGPGPLRLEAGTHGLSNHLVDTPWPKVSRIRSGLESLCAGESSITSEALMGLLEDRHQPRDDALPDTGVGLALERLLAPACIVGREYGTRSSTVALVGSDGQVDFVERSRARDGSVTSESAHRFRIS